MESALWHLEDQWNLSTHKVIALFSSSCVLILIIGLCLCYKRKSWKGRGSVHQEPPPGGRGLMKTARWSGASKWDGSGEAPTALLGKRDSGDGSHSSSSAVWQKPILMGEKCELPRFSGLILYDQRGSLLDPHRLHVQESAPIVRTTLKDLL